MIDWSSFEGVLDLVAGGPPCQPFSVGGKSAGNDDERDMWPEAIRAVRETMPKAFVFENVRGLLRPKFEAYVEWLSAYLANPSFGPLENETHKSHLCRLKNAIADSTYSIQIIPVNTADYGAPQKRNRVLIIGLRRDLGATASFPIPTHSQERLIWDKWVTGAYWEKHRLPPPALIPTTEAKILAKLKKSGIEPTTKPWVTCRDIFATLGEPGTRHDIANHNFQPGAKIYTGHTGSPIDEPAKALKAGVHGVPGGENMLLREDGSVRYFSVREAAALQGLPIAYEFPGSWSESMRQLGNAVPVQLSQFVGEWVKATLQNSAQPQRETA